MYWVECRGTLCGLWMCGYECLLAGAMSTCVYLLPGSQGICVPGRKCGTPRSRKEAVSVNHPRLPAWRPETPANISLLALCTQTPSHTQGPLCQSHGEDPCCTHGTDTHTATHPRLRAWEIYTHTQRFTVALTKRQYGHLQGRQHVFCTKTHTHSLRLPT